MNYQAVLIPGGGLTKDGCLPLWTKKRLDKVLDIYQGEYIITLSGGTVHQSQILDKHGFPIFESFAAADYLLKQGIKREKIIREWMSYDTIGNAFFTRLLHTDPRQWKNLLIVNSAFHLPRTKAIFQWVFKLDNPGYQLDFLKVSDKGIDQEIIKARIKEEKKKLVKVKKLIKKIKSLKQLHRWLFKNHQIYAVGLEIKRKIDKNLLKSY